MLCGAAADAVASTDWEQAPAFIIEGPNFNDTAVSPLCELASPLSVTDVMTADHYDHYQTRRACGD